MGDDQPIIYAPPKRVKPYNPTAEEFFRAIIVFLDHHGVRGDLTYIGERSRTYGPETTCKIRNVVMNGESWEPSRFLSFTIWDKSIESLNARMGSDLRQVQIYEATVAASYPFRVDVKSKILRFNLVVVPRPDRKLLISPITRTDPDGTIHYQWPQP